MSAADDQRGIVSTYVSMGVIGILGLISISFAALMQTEYTQARDRQASTQARISAETAINDARQLVHKAIGDRLNITEFIARYDTCGPDSDGDGFGDPDGVVSGYDNTYGSDSSICEFIARYDNYDAIHNDGIVIYNACISTSPPDCVPSNEFNQHDHHVTTPTVLDIFDVQAAAGIAIDIPQSEFYDANQDDVIDANDDILQRPYDTLLIEEWYDCGSGTGRPGFEGDLNDPSASSSDPNIGYTCVEVDGRPVKLVYDDIDTDRSENILLQTRWLDGSVFKKSNIDELTINWQGLNSPNLNDFKTATDTDHEQKLHPPSSWTHPAPMLRVQIIPLNLRDGWTRDELSESTKTYYLYPTKFSTSGCISGDALASIYSGSYGSWEETLPPPRGDSCPAQSISTTEDGSIINADCDGDEELACTAKIAGFSGNVSTYNINDAPSDIGNISDGTCSDPNIKTQAACVAPETWTTPPNDEMAYIVLIRSIYADAKVEVSAINSNGDDLRFVNQQINITANGIAGGLSYRLREVIPIRPKYNRPEFAIDSSEHICKVLIGEPDTGVSYDYSLIRGTFSNQVGSLTHDQEAFCRNLHP